MVYAYLKTHCGRSHFWGLLPPLQPTETEETQIKFPISYLVAEKRSETPKIPLQLCVFNLYKQQDFSTDDKPSLLGTYLNNPKVA